ncbi:MAG: dihydrolipoyllysine-residue acetyltransferase [Candidatus Nitrotoga sp.]|nr:dihydrolipoyllysine-residue acetyltransferase [Candidatus Nitrotoga sp.]MBP0123074.1 dihydrolipoyllysine-residue acetyltransferase [Candidatus Nitrotoga sp.]MBP0125798.1 dihydrolipoyllysine-residue acetyltransferase [Candidatus Nitrotoga sp.]
MRVTEIKQVLVPDIGDTKNVPVIEIMVKVGDTIRAEQSLLTLETDKATMDIPAPFDGVIKNISVKVGDKISEGALLLLVEVSATKASTLTTPPVAHDSVKKTDNLLVEPLAVASVVLATTVPSVLAGRAHASPSVRHFAHELGVDLERVRGSGIKGRITRCDVQGFVKSTLSQQQGGGLQVAAMPIVDFSRFGVIEIRALSRIKKLSGANLHRNWVSIPHVTQHDEADITEIEAFRKELGEKYRDEVRVTLLPFLLKAVVRAMQQYPNLNSSLGVDGESVALKKYFHIGVAVDTVDGLVVPVLRDVDKKGIVQLSRELGEISVMAREKSLPATAMQGGCFTISSLGGIGGTFFTPIINAPEVAILGVSRASMTPIYVDGKFVPRLMLPLSLSYDHRVVDGAEAVRFTGYLGKALLDAREMEL